MIDLYYWPTPNGHKIPMLLEELVEQGHGLEYTIKPVDIGAGDQFKPDFLAISPNNKMPAIVDRAPAEGGAPISVFESGAILLYLAEKTGRLLSRGASFDAACVCVEAAGESAGGAAVERCGAQTPVWSGRTVMM